MNTEEILNKQTLYTLYIEQKLTDQQIAKQFGLTLGQVHRLRKKYQIKTLEQYERWQKPQLTEEETRIIVGTLFGDGHMRRRHGKNTYPQLLLEQSVIHREYIYWLFERLQNWVVDKN